MILRGMGEVRSFRISSRLIFFCLLFLGLYVAASVLVINQYFVELRAHKTQVALLTQLQREIEGTQKELYRSRQQLAMLKDHILKDAGEERKASEPAPEPAVGPDTELDLMAERHQPESPAGQAGDGSRRALVEIKDLQVRKTGAQLEIRFRLVNADAMNEQLRGYVHIIAVETAPETPQIWTYPKVALREGAPVDFKSGYLFSIRNYIDIRARMFLNKETDNPSDLRLLIYDESGALIFEREFEVAEVS